jgi:alkylmercury lyase
MTTAPQTFAEVLPDSFTAVAAGGIAASQAALPAELREFHRRLLTEFLHAGEPPRPDRLAALAADLGLETEPALAALATADLVHRDGAGRVETAYPLSGRRTAHVVHAAGLPPVNAMCAVDALGVLTMSGRDGVVISTDPTTGEAVQVERAGSDWQSLPDSLVVVLGAEDGCSGAIAVACLLANFHADAERAEVYLAERPGVSGRVLPLPDAIRIAENEFGPLLT